MARKAQRVGAKRHRFRVADFSGEYSFRFQGFGRRLAPGKNAFHLIGIGRLTLDGAGHLTGGQVSTICPITGGMDGMDHGAFGSRRFDLVGTYSINSYGVGTVTIDFKFHGTVVNKDTFAVVATSNSGASFWLISTAPQTGGGAPVEELVSGEAIRLA
ncbi:hypothetical protein [Reyranella sp.]|uniref:hypothetical protein n=1 Tax=Reyranella sp. TaxID=1929291 RepID=UPI00378391E1